MMTPRDQLADQFRRAVQKLVFVSTDVCDLIMTPQRVVKSPRTRETASRIRGFNFHQKRRATKREQRIVGNAAKRRTKHGREREFVSLVVEKAEQLNQIGDLFALVETAAEYGLIRNVRAMTQVQIYESVFRRAKQQ